MKIFTREFALSAIVVATLVTTPAFAQMPPVGGGPGLLPPGGNSPANAPGPKTAPTFGGTTWNISVPNSALQKIEFRTDKTAVVTSKSTSSVRFTWQQNNGAVTVTGTMGSENLTITGSLATKIQGGFEVNTGSVSIASIVNGKAMPTLAGNMSKVR
jgi:hypothetical protein